MNFILQIKKSANSVKKYTVSACVCISIGISIANANPGGQSDAAERTRCETIEDQACIAKLDKAKLERLAEDKAAAAAIEPTIPTPSKPQPPAVPAHDSGAATSSKGAGIKQAIIDRNNDTIKNLGTSAHSRLGEAVNRVTTPPPVSKTPVSPVVQERRRKDKDIVFRTRDLLEDNKPIPTSLVRQVHDPEVREDLEVVAVLQDEKKVLEKENKNHLAQIAQLLAMAATNLRHSQDLGSISESAATGAPKGGIGDQSANAAALQSSTLGDKTDISEEAAAAELAEAEGEKGDVSKATEAKAKIREAIEAAAKRKKSLALRNRLREKVNGKKGDAEGTENLFDGKLTPESNEVLAKGGSSSAEARDTDKRFGGAPVLKAMEAMQSGFKMSGAETDAEVNRMLAEAERELSPQEIQAGILGVETISLFERVKLAHNNCLKDKCVTNQISP